MSKLTDLNISLSTPSYSLKITLLYLMMSLSSKMIAILNIYFCQIRTPDLAFDCVIPVIMVLISFSVGLVTNYDDLKTFRQYLVPLLLGIFCQFVCMPLVSTSFNILRIPIIKDYYTFEV